MSSTKAVILSAGFGSRIRPLTDNNPKTLLSVGGITILERMLTSIQSCGIDEIVVVVGYQHERIETFVCNKFPELNVRFVVNNRYGETNTGYSLMLAEEFMAGSSFVKFDGDVVFDEEVLRRLLASTEENCLCIDRNIQLESEEVKVVLDSDIRIIRVGKDIAPSDAIGESIGIEKISGYIGTLLFAELRAMMRGEENLQEYYEGAYERLIKRGVAFHAVDITGLKWTEIDTRQDFETAERIFA
jgi:choline kinase